MIDLVATRALVLDAISNSIGHAHPSDPHSWRCYDKDRYPGPCGCDEEIADEVMGAIATLYDEAARLRAGCEDGQVPDRTTTGGQQMTTGTPRTEAQIKAEALREAAQEVVGLVRYGAELRHDGSEDPLMASYVEGLRDAFSLLTQRADRIESEATE